MSSCSVTDSKNRSSSSSHSMPVRLRIKIAFIMSDLTYSRWIVTCFLISSWKSWTSKPWLTPRNRTTLKPIVERRHQYEGSKFNSTQISANSRPSRSKLRCVFSWVLISEVTALLDATRPLIPRKILREIEEKILVKDGYLFSVRLVNAWRVITSYEGCWSFIRRQNSVKVEVLCEDMIDRENRWKMSFF